jgi:hypothetical protein
LKTGKPKTTHIFQNILLAVEDKHHKPAFMGRRRDSRSIFRPPSQVTPTFVMFYEAVATWQVTFKVIHNLPRTGQSH